MDEQSLNNQLESIYNNSVPIQDVALKTSRERWTIEPGGMRGSGRSLLAARHNDDNDDDLCNNSFSYYKVKFRPYNRFQTVPK